MPETKEEQREKLVRATRDVLLEVRAMYLAFGGNSLRHWSQIQDRVRAATRTTTNPGEWVTRVMRDLQIPAPCSSLAHAIDSLCSEVEDIGTIAWLDMVEREISYIIALMRLESERRRALRDEAKREDEDEAA